MIRPDKDHYITLVSSFVSCAVGVTDWDKPYGKNLLDIQVFWPRDPGKSRIRWP